MIPSARLAWLVVALLWVVAVLNYLDRQVVFSLFPVFRSELRMSDPQLGMLSSVFLFVYGAVSLVAGFLAVRWGVSRTIVLSLGIWSLVTLATGLARTPGELLATRALMGFSEAFYMPAGLTLVAALHGDRTRGRATALHQSGNFTGIVAGGVLGGWFAVNWGWRSGFFILGALGTLYALPLWGLLRRTVAGLSEATPRRGSLPRLAGELVRLRGYPSMLAVFGLYSAAGWLVVTWMPLYLYERFRMGLVEAGFTATFYFNLGAFSGLFLGGWLSDWLSARSPAFRVHLPALGFVCSAFFLFVAAATESRPILALALTLFGFGRGLYDCNIMPLLCYLARPELRAIGYGVFNCGGCIAGGVMAAVAGVLKSSIGLEGSMRWTAG